MVKPMSAFANDEDGRLWRLSHGHVCTFTAGRYMFTWINQGWTPVHALLVALVSTGARTLCYFCHHARHP